MEKEQALQVIEQALHIAIGKGVFKVEESAIILTAFISVKNLLTPPVPAEEVLEEKIETPLKKIK